MSYDYINILNALIMLRRTIESLDSLPEEQKSDTIARRCDRTEKALKDLEDIVLESKDTLNSGTIWMRAVTYYQRALDSCNAVSALLAEAHNKAIVDIRDELDGEIEFLRDLFQPICQRSGSVEEEGRQGKSGAGSVGDTPQGPER